MAAADERSVKADATPIPSQSIKSDYVWSTDPQPTLTLSGNATLVPRSEGLWSIGSGWSDDAPTSFVHGNPSESTTLGPWAVLSGSLQTSDGLWQIQDQYREVSEGLIQAKRRWHYLGEKPSGPVVLTIEFQVGETKRRSFLPGINYFGNPSGTRIDANRVPTWSSQPGAEALYEEHRYPLPFASIEEDKRFVAALHSRPSVLPHAARDDLWWSLGLVETAEATVLSLQSGPVASNGKRGVVKARQKSFLPYPNAYLTSIPPDTVIEKEFHLQLQANDSVGHGFAKPLWTSIDLFAPEADRSMPRPIDVIGAKLRDTFQRWHQDEQCRGFRTRPPQAQPWFLMGWADRAEVPGHALLALDLDHYTDTPDLWRERAIESLDFLVTSPTQPGQKHAGFSIGYDYQKHQWLRRQNPLSQAQALNAIADVIVIAANDTKASQTARQHWRPFLKTALSRIAAGVLDPDWRPVSTNEAFAIAPLVKGSELFNESRLLRAARKLADHTIDRHQSMREPYWGGTLDAKCEDKEGAWAALQGFAKLYETTQEQKYLNAAIHAADVCLSYLYVWDVALPPGRLADHNVKTRGWTSVSVQNQHLDVFGVIFTPQLWQLGKWTGDPRYQTLARLMFVSAGQMTDLASGTHGEQLFQTNYQQHGADGLDTVEGMRGGYSESWNIYWISAHFLTAATGFQKLGVDWTKF